MARKQDERFNWYEHRLTLVLGFIAFIMCSIYCLSILFMPEAPTEHQYQGEDGRTYREFIAAGSSVPLRVQVYGLDGSLEEVWYVSNENGRFESRHFFSGDELTEQVVSLADDGIYELRRTVSGEEVLESYDRDHDGRFEETRLFRNTLRVREEIDRDGDGNPDQRVIYDEEGRLLRLELDYNSDGTMDIIYPPTQEDVARLKRARALPGQQNQQGRAPVTHRRQP